MNAADLFSHACALRGMAGDMGAFGDSRVPCIVKAADRLDQMRVALGILNLLVRCADMAKADGQPQCIGGRHPAAGPWVGRRVG